MSDLVGVFAVFGALAFLCLCVVCVAIFSGYSVTLRFDR